MPHLSRTAKKLLSLLTYKGEVMISVRFPYHTINRINQFFVFLSGFRQHGLFASLLGHIAKYKRKSSILTQGIPEKCSAILHRDFLSIFGEKKRRIAKS